MGRDNLLRTKVEKCPECGSKDIIKDYDTGEDVCSNCGLVVIQKIYDRGPEWRAYDEEERKEKSRIGSPLTYTIHDMGLMTSISDLNYDAHGRPLKLNQKFTASRLRKWQTRIRISDAKERSLAYGLAQIAKLSQNLNLPKNVMEEASLIFRKSLKEGILRGRSIDAVAAASIYLSCRELEIPRRLDQISETAGVPKIEIGRSYREIVEKLNYQPSPLSSSKYISKLLDGAGKSGKTKEIAYKILLVAKELKLTCGKSPISLAAAAAYIASTLTGERMTQRELSKEAGCTEVTIRNRYKDLMNSLLFHLTL